MAFGKTEKQVGAQIAGRDQFQRRFEIPLRIVKAAVVPGHFAFVGEEPAKFAPVGIARAQLLGHPLQPVVAPCLQKFLRKIQPHDGGHPGNVGQISNKWRKSGGVVQRAGRCLNFFRQPTAYRQVDAGRLAGTGLLGKAEVFFRARDVAACKPKEAAL